MILRLYQILSVILLPLILILLYIRKRQGKEDSARFNERVGRPMIPRPEEFLIWIHVASVGEAVSVLPIINKLLEQHRDIQILVTTGTVSSANLLSSRLPSRAFHQ